MGDFALNRYGRIVTSSKDKVVLASDWPGQLEYAHRRPPPPSLRGCCRLHSQAQPIGCFCPLARSGRRERRSPATATQNVGNVYVPHVCASEPGPPQASEPGGGHLVARRRRRRTHAVYGQTAGRARRCDGWSGPGDSPGAASTAESGEALRVRSKCSPSQRRRGGQREHAVELNRRGSSGHVRVY